MIFFEGRSVFRTQSIIDDEVCKIVNGFERFCKKGRCRKAVNQFCKKLAAIDIRKELHFGCLTGFCMCPYNSRLVMKKAY